MTRLSRAEASRRRPGNTDWTRVDATRDSDLRKAAQNDAEWLGVDDIDWSKATPVEPPKKRAISIRLDEDVLEFFKEEGAGYQRRINAVLRGYMMQRDTSGGSSRRSAGAKPAKSKHRA